MELPEFLNITQDACDKMILASRQVETHSKTEQDVLGALRQAFLHIRIIKEIGDKALMKEKAI